jgi:hypothetical protein
LRFQIGVDGTGIQVLPPELEEGRDRAGYRPSNPRIFLGARGPGGPEGGPRKRGKGKKIKGKKRKGKKRKEKKEGRRRKNRKEKKKGPHTGSEASVSLNHPRDP